MNSALSKRAAVVVALLCLIAGCNSWESDKPAVKGETAATSSLDRVTAGNPVRKSLQLFTEQPGRVVAFEEAPILSKLAGYVASVYFDIGDKVEKGQILLRIHAPEYQDQLEQKRGLVAQAEAQMEQAQAALGAAEAASYSSKSIVVQVEAGVGRADAEYARWDSELKRIQQLVSKGSVTPKLADETSSRFRSADAARNEALANVESAKALQREAEAKILTAQADIEAAKARLKIAQSEIAQAETMLAYTQIAAPFDGYVTSRHVDSGHYVQPAGASSSMPLMTIANIRKVRVFVNVPEGEAGWVDAGFGSSDIGDPVTILSPSLPNGRIESRVTRTSFQLDPQSRSLSVEIDLDNDNFKILPGAFVTTRLLLEQRENVLTLPTGAILTGSNGTKCCLVVDGKIQHHPIELGLRVGDEVEIKSGLDGNQVVVLQRANSLQDGQAVEIIGQK